MALACHRILKNGLIIQWGHKQRTARDVNVTLLITMSNYEIILGCNTSSTSYPASTDNLVVRNKTSSSFTLSLNAEGSAWNMSWLAIGY